MYLVDRERRTRFTGGMLGYAWAYITPLVWIGLIVGMFSYLGRIPPIDAGVEIFVTTGVLSYVAFRQTVTAKSRILSSHRHLRYYSEVGTSDLLTASMLLEAINTLVTSFILFTATTLFFGSPPPESIPIVLFALFISWMLGVGIGRFVAFGGQLSDTFARSVPLVLRPFFWLSGIFYVAAELPQSAQELIWWSPFLHVSETMREGYFLGFNSSFADPWYPMVIAIGFFLASIPLELYAERRRILYSRL